MARAVLRLCPRGPTRRFGTLITWFLLGGDIYTAYTFIAIPALAFGAGALAFFAVPYTIIIYPLLFIVFPRLWYVCRKHGYVTAAGFRQRALRQSLAGAGDHHHRHRGDYAVHRAAARRPAAAVWSVDLALNAFRLLRLSAGRGV